MDIFFEIIGYLGTGIVIISMLMTSLTKLRVINVAGAVLSTAYAIWTEAWPVVLLNCVLMSINVYKIIRALAAEVNYESVPAHRGDRIVECFVTEHAKDIARTCPELLSLPEEAEGALVMRGSGIAGVVFTSDGGTATVYMDRNNRNKASERICRAHGAKQEIV